MDYDQWAKDVYQNAVDHGWYDDGERNDADTHMLIITEVAEATEEVRKSKPAIYQIQGGMEVTPEFAAMHNGWNPNGKPEGEAIELADAAIRIMDIFGAKGWSLGKCIQDHWSFAPPHTDKPLEQHLNICRAVVAADELADASAALSAAVLYIEHIFKKRGWDFEKTISMKHEYNKTRPYKHGNKAY